MTISFSHDGPQWGSLAYSHFRKDIARHEGIDLDAMEGFRPLFTPNDRWQPISWATVTTPLRPLLACDDHMGELTPDACRQVAPRLREVIDALWPTSPGKRQRPLLLADAMERAAACGEPLEFS